MTDSNNTQPSRGQSVATSAQILELFARSFGMTYAEIAAAAFYLGTAITVRSCKTGPARGAELAIESVTQIAERLVELSKKDS
jgi:hypothetical protein